jgi:hypothetical protein
LGWASEGAGDRVRVGIELIRGYRNTGALKRVVLYKKRKERDEKTGRKVGRERGMDRATIDAFCPGYNGMGANGVA